MNYLDLSSPLEIENIQAMERARRGAYSFRGRFNERAEVNESHDNINERRQQDRFVLLLECELSYYGPLRYM